MGRQAELLITESLKELKNLKVRQKTLTNQKRLLALIRIHTGQDETRQELANHLAVHIRTLERWVCKYKEGGMGKLLEPAVRRKGSKIITSEIHEGLALRLTDPKKSFKGYWDAQNWIKLTYGIDVKYQRVREKISC